MTSLSPSGSWKEGQWGALMWRSARFLFPSHPPSAPVLPERTPAFCCCPYEDIVLGPMMR